MLRITFPYIFFISLTALGGSILNSYNKFCVPAFTPVLLNLSLVGAAIFMAPHFHNPVVSLSWGVFIGGVMQLFFQLPFLMRLRLLPKPKISWKDKGVRRVIKLMAPAIIGVSVAQISLLIDTMFASFLQAGSIAWLYFSDRLTGFPLGVIGVTVATVILPHLSRKNTINASKEFSSSLDWALRCVLVLGIPAATGLFILAGPLLSTLFQHLRFGAHDVEKARLSVMAFAIGLPAFMLIKTLVSGFYARQNIRTPVYIAIIVLIVNMILAFVLIFPLAYVGLALATSITASLNAGLLFYFLCKRKIYQPKKGWLLYWIRLIFANMVMGIFLYMFRGRLVTWLGWSWEERAIHLLS